MTKLNHTKQQFDDIIKSHNSTILFKQISSDLTTPIQASINLFAKYNKYHFLLESAQNNQEGKNAKGRFCAIGIDPDQIYKCENSQAFLSADDNLDNFKPEETKPLLSFRKFFHNAKIDFSKLCYQGGNLPALAAGIFGYFGYDMVNLMENIPSQNQIDEINVPDGLYIRPQIVVIFDNFYDIALICAPKYQDSGKSYEELSAKIQEVENTILQTLPQKKSINRKIDFNFESSHSKSEYCKIVENCKEYIKNGDVFQILPSQRFTSKFDKSISEFDFYRSLRSLNPSPFLFYFKLNDFVLTGSSPEILVSLKNKTVTIRPLAGTRKRGATPEEDKNNAQDLLSDEKELAEHLMLIDLGRHDVGRVAKSGSVKTTRKMDIEYYSHVMHISSNVQGEIRHDLDALDALISGFPAGTVSGAPKIRAMQILSQTEKIKRSFYAGCTGYFSSNGDMETCINLRSALIKNEKIYLQAAAGVVYDSDPKSEYEECYNKANALIKACENIN